MRVTWTVFCNIECDIHVRLLPNLALGRALSSLGLSFLTVKRGGKHIPSPRALTFFDSSITYNVKRGSGEIRL